MLTITFKTSLIEELKEAANLLRKPEEYRHLRSVIWPSPFNVVRFLLGRGAALRKAKKTWKLYQSPIHKCFEHHKLPDLGKVTCYVHFIGCEGWYNPDKNWIHARLFKCGGKREFAKTLLHEMLHLATHKPQLSYKEREEIVERLEKACSKFLKLRTIEP